MVHNSLELSKFVSYNKNPADPLNHASELIDPRVIFSRCFILRESTVTWYFLNSKQLDAFVQIISISILSICLLFSSGLLHWLINSIFRDEYVFLF